MKKIILVLTFLTGIAQAGTKIDPMLNILAARPEGAAKAMKSFGVKSADDKLYAEVFIKAASLHTDDASLLIVDAGGTIMTVIGDIITATIPLDAVSMLAESEYIVYIEAAKPLHYKMDYARSLTSADIVQSGTGTGGVAYTGSGVIVGVVDSGIDCAHADFQDGSGNTRILAYWDQTLSGSGVSEVSSSSGVEHTGTALSDGTCSNMSPDESATNDGGGHGTHVAGISAGSNSIYKGVAPGAGIIAVKLDQSGALSGSGAPLSTRVVEAVQYIFKKAQANSKPAVVNLSIGTSLGAHDGTSLMESGLDNLLIESGSTEKQGRAIVNAAGNENAAILNNSSYGGIHASIDVVASAPKGYEFLTFSSGNANPVGHVGGTWADIWLTSASSCTIAINALDRTDKTQLKVQMTPVSKSSSNESNPTTYDTLEMYVDFSDSANTLNGKQHAVALITDSSSSKLDNYSFDLVFNGTCEGDVWLYYDYVYDNIFTSNRSGTTNTATSTTYTYAAGDSDSTMTIPATANRVIAVGSYLGRDEWTDVASTAHSQVDYWTDVETVGGISYFSSLGPTADSRTKPEVTAPGEPIISTLVSNNTVTNAYKGDSTHWKQQGTSMAAPHVAGIVALMLEKNKCLKAADIKSDLTAYADSVSGVSLPDNTWGYGKVNAADSVNAVTASTCTPDNASEEASDDDDDSTAATASSSCSLDRPAKFSIMSVFVAFFIIFGLLLALHGAKTHKKGRSK